ncbi:MAG: Ig-like domain-containing protein [Bacteroidota bacterium]
MKYFFLFCLLLTYLYFIGLFAAGAGCATPFPPEGGDRDSIPPQLVLEESTPNRQVNFRPEEIVLTFDEWVVLTDPTQIVISPPVDLGEGPELKRKSLIIPFEDVVWEDSVTYTVNLGESIVDFTEKNPVENIRYVFSTGPELDSAEVRGQVLDAYTGEGKEKVLVSLYANLVDSAITTQRPFYFGFTDEDGKYELGNLKPGNYRLYALENAAGIYEYGSSTSAFAFIDTAVVIGDSYFRMPDLRMSPLPQAVQVDVDSSRRRVLKLGFDRPVLEVPVRTLNADYIRVTRNDTLRLFYETASSDTILIGDEAMGIDTIIISAADWEELKEDEPIQLQEAPNQATYPGQTVELNFSRPLSAVDSSLVEVLPDTLDNTQDFTLELNGMRLEQLKLRSPWEVNKRYQVVFQPGAVTDFEGLQNQDTISFNLQGADPANVGMLRLRISDLDASQSYVAKLIDDGNNGLIDRFSMSGDTTYAQTFERLKAGNYRVEIIEDVNGNGRYDGGDWPKRRQPERVRIYKLDALRANWELEAEISLEAE